MAQRIEITAQTKSKLWQLFAEDLQSHYTDELHDVDFTFKQANASKVEEKGREKKPNETIVKANRGLLSVFSPVFRKMFQSDLRSPIPIDDSDSESFKIMVQYCYGMVPQITANNIGAILHLAKKYEIKGLQKICDLFLTDSISIGNVVSILESLHGISHKYEEKLYEKCQVWISKQTSMSTESIITLFESETFIHTHHEIVKILVSGFGKVIDAETLWTCVSKWAETKSTKYCVVINESGGVINEYVNEEKETMIEGEHDIKSITFIQRKWAKIRDEFPFYRLPINIISTSVLPLNILTKEMALSVLSYKTFGHQSALVNYCINSDNPKQITAADQFLSHNLDKYDVSMQDYELRVKSKDGPYELYGKSPMKSGDVYEWTVHIIEYNQNAWTGFGMEVVDDDRKANDTWPGMYKSNSYGIYVQSTQMRPYCDGSHQATISQGIGTGSIITFRYDGIHGILNVFANKTQNYTFTGINKNQIYRPSFKTPPTTIWTIKYLSRPFF